MYLLWAVFFSLGIEILVQFGSESIFEKVFVKCQYGHVTISLDEGLKEGSDFILPWGNLGRLIFDIDSPVLSFEGRGDYFIISSEMSDRIFSVKVFKVFDSKQQTGLSITVHDIGKGKKNLDENHTGLLGYIGSKEYIFVTPSKGNEHTQTLVVSNRVMKTFRKSKDSCYSVNLDEVLYPRTVGRFKRINL